MYVETWHTYGKSAAETPVLDSAEKDEVWLQKKHTDNPPKSKSTPGIPKGSWTLGNAQLQGSCRPQHCLRRAELKAAWRRNQRQAAPAGILGRGDCLRCHWGKCKLPFLASSFTYNFGTRAFSVPKICPQLQRGMRLGIRLTAITKHYSIHDAYGAFSPSSWQEEKELGPSFQLGAVPIFWIIVHRPASK